MSVVSVGTSTKIIHEFLESHGMANLSELHPSEIAGKTKIFVNGAWIGIHKEPESLIGILRDKRRKTILPKEISIINNYSSKEIK